MVKVTFSARDGILARGYTVRKVTYSNGNVQDYHIFENVPMWIIISNAS